MKRKAAGIPALARVLAFSYSLVATGTFATVGTSLWFLGSSRTWRVVQLGATRIPVTYGLAQLLGVTSGVVLVIGAAFVVRGRRGGTRSTAVGLGVGGVGAVCLTLLLAFLSFGHAFQTSPEARDTAFSAILLATFTATLAGVSVVARYRLVAEADATGGAERPGGLQ